MIPLNSELLESYKKRWWLIVFGDRCCSSYQTENQMRPLNAASCFVSTCWARQRSKRWLSVDRLTGLRRSTIQILAFFFTRDKRFFLQAIEGFPHRLLLLWFWSKPWRLCTAVALSATAGHSVIDAHSNEASFQISGQTLRKPLSLSSH